jgi:ankyrin repeat protein
MNFHPLHVNCPILEAIRFGRVDELNKYLVHGHGIDEPIGPNWPSALHAAAFFSDERIVAMLLDRGASCEIQDDYGNTALHLAATTGSTNTIAMLLPYSNPYQTNCRGRTPLHNVAKNNKSSVDAVSKMLEFSNDSVLKRDLDGKIPSYYSETREISNLLKSVERSAIQHNIDASRRQTFDLEGSHAVDHGFLPGLGINNDYPGRMSSQTHFNHRVEADSQDLFGDYEESNSQLELVDWYGEPESPPYPRRLSNASFDSNLPLNWDCDRGNQEY